MQAPRDCFDRARQAYVQKHQACIGCQQSHCVFLSQERDVVEYRCYQCGYFVSHRQRTNEFLVGQDPPDAVLLLGEEQPTLLVHLEDHPALRAG